MECGVCTIRSSLGYCAACRMLLCDQCAIPCEQCKALSCPSHIHLTRSGKKLCQACFDERQARKAAHVQHHDRDEEAVNTAFAAERSPEHDHVEILAEALTTSGYKKAPMWRLSLYTACVGAVAMLFVLIFNSYQYVLVPAVGWVKTPTFLLIIPLFALLWAVMGWFKEPYYTDRLRCLLGAAIAIVTIGVGLGIIKYNDLTPTERARMVVPTTRDNMNPVQLEAWRQKTLEHFEGK